MSDPAPEDDLQNAIDRAAYMMANPKRAKTWRKATCPLCGRTISEGAGSGIKGNLRRHIEACERKHEAGK